MKKALLTMAALLIIPIAANANTLSLTPVVGNQFQQSVQSPCIFSNPSCQNGAFPTTNLDTGGNVSTYNVFSQVYTGSALLAIMGAGPLRLGLDINEASGQGPQTLTNFFMLKNGVVVDTYGPGTTGNVPAGNNGNGFADYILQNFSTFVGTDSIQFHLVFNDANSGTENVFVIAGTPVVTTAEPSTVITTLLGLVFLGMAATRFAPSLSRS